MKNTEVLHTISLRKAKKKPSFKYNFPMSIIGLDPNHNPNWKAQTLEPYTRFPKLLHNRSHKGLQIEFNLPIFSTIVQSIFLPSKTKTKTKKYGI
jgi:hypothetical protein